MHFLTKLFSVKTTSLSRTAKEDRWLDPTWKTVSHPMWSTHYSISLVFLVKFTLGDRQDISPSRRFFICLTEREKWETRTFELEIWLYQLIRNRHRCAPLTTLPEPAWVTAGSSSSFEGRKKKNKVCFDPVPSQIGKEVVADESQSQIASVVWEIF